LPPDSPLLRAHRFFEQDDDAFLAAKRQSDCANPVPIHSASPKYPPAAMQAKLQGDVALDVIVLADGSVGKVRVTSSLDRHFGLDREAVMAARQWKFKPGTCQGVPVDTTIGLSILFRLH
jgi:TonB family protein